MLVEDRARFERSLPTVLSATFLQEIRVVRLDLERR